MLPKKREQHEREKKKKQAQDQAQWRPTAGPRTQNVDNDEELSDEDE